MYDECITVSSIPVKQHHRADIHNTQRTIFPANYHRSSVVWMPLRAILTWHSFAVNAPVNNLCRPYQGSKFTQRCGQIDHVASLRLIALPVRRHKQEDMKTANRMIKKNPMKYLVPATTSQSNRLSSWHISNVCYVSRCCDVVMKVSL